MGVIQNSINSGISVAELLYTQSAMHKVRLEEKQRQADIATKERQYEALGKKFGSGLNREEYERNAKAVLGSDMKNTEMVAQIDIMKEGRAEQEKINDKLLELGSEKAIDRKYQDLKYQYNAIDMREQRRAWLQQEQQSDDLRTAAAQEALAKAQRQKKRQRVFRKPTMWQPGDANNKPVIGGDK